MISLFVRVLQLGSMVWKSKIGKFFLSMIGGMFLFSIVLSMLVGCSTGQYKNGKFDDIDRINLLSDSFSESTAEILSKSTVEQFKDCKALASYKIRPYVAIQGISNRTQEADIDMVMVSNQIQTSLINSGRFQFIDKVAREAIEEEHQYQETGAVSVGSKKARGGQQGVDLLLLGDLFHIVQQAGKDKTSYYQLNTKLTDMNTGVVVCVAEQRVRTKFRKQ